MNQHRLPASARRALCTALAIVSFALTSHAQPGPAPCSIGPRNAIVGTVSGGDAIVPPATRSLLEDVVMSNINFGTHSTGATKTFRVRYQPASAGYHHAQVVARYPRMCGLSDYATGEIEGAGTVLTVSARADKGTTIYPHGVANAPLILNNPVDDIGIRALAITLKYNANMLALPRIDNLDSAFTRGTIAEGWHATIVENGPGQVDVVILAPDGANGRPE